MYSQGFGQRVKGAEVATDASQPVVDKGSCSNRPAIQDFSDCESQQVCVQFRPIHSFSLW